MPLKCTVCEHVFADFDACPKCGSQEVVRLARRGPAALIVVTLLGVLLAAILVPNLLRSEAQGEFSGCLTNLDAIGGALEIYSTDFEGRYPLALGSLTPNYLRVLPTCPAAGTDTYSNGYRPARGPANYTLYCSGLNHQGAGVSAGYPQYAPKRGLVERP